MSIIPTVKLYASDGVTLAYTFTYVQETNMPLTQNKSVVHSGFRGKGGIVIDGGLDVFDLYVKFILSAADYEALTTLIDALESAIAINTPYVLELQKSSSTEYSYNVKRVSKIEYEPSLRTDIQKITVTFKANAW